jgi:hypothetical protein
VSITKTSHHPKNQSSLKKIKTTYLGQLPNLGKSSVVHSIINELAGRQTEIPSPILGQERADTVLTQKFTENFLTTKLC